MLKGYWLEEFLSSPRDFIDSFYKQGKYYQKIKAWDQSNKKRKRPRAYYVFTLDEEDAKRNATFSTFEFGIQDHIIRRGYLNKIASLMPMNSAKEYILKLAGIQIEENVFVAPEVTIDPVLRGWIKLRSGCSIGWGTKMFNHLFEDNGKIIIGYIDIGEEVSIGGFVSISPGVTIHKKANVGAEVIIAPGVTIEKYAKVGAGSFVLPFLTIGEGAEVMMGSVVTESVAPGTKVQGNPAKIIMGKIKDRKPKLDLIINPNLDKDNQAMQ